MPTAVITGQMFQLDPADSSHIFDFSTFESIWRNGYLIVFHSCKNPIDCGQKYFQGKIVFTICGSNVIASFKYRRKQLSNVHIMDDMVIAILGFEWKYYCSIPDFGWRLSNFHSFLLFIHSLLYLHIDVKYLNIWMKFLKFLKFERSHRWRRDRPWPS